MEPPSLRHQDWEALFERARDARAAAVETRLLLQDARAWDGPSNGDGSGDSEDDE